MGGSGIGQGPQIIAALQSRNQTVTTCRRRNVSQGLAQPGKILCLHIELGKRVAFMGIEARGYKQKVRLKLPKCGQNHIGVGSAKFC